MIHEKSVMADVQAIKDKFAAQGQALNDYYNAIKKLNNPSSDQISNLKQQILQPAQESLQTAVNDTWKAQETKIWKGYIDELNKEYDKFLTNLEKLSDKDKLAEIKKTLKRPVILTPAEAAKKKGEKPKLTQAEVAEKPQLDKIEKAPSVQLDGSKIPKEIEFTGKVLKGKDQ
jgi:hypothetical protein